MTGLIEGEAPHLITELGWKIVQHVAITENLGHASPAETLAYMHPRRVDPPIPLLVWLDFMNWTVHGDKVAGARVRAALEPLTAIASRQGPA